MSKDTEGKDFIFDTLFDDEREREGRTGGTLSSKMRRGSVFNEGQGVDISDYSLERARTLFVAKVEEMMKKPAGGEFSPEAFLRIFDGEMGYISGDLTPRNRNNLKKAVEVMFKNLMSSSDPRSREFYITQLFEQIYGIFEKDRRDKIQRRLGRQNEELHSDSFSTVKAKQAITAALFAGSAITSWVGFSAIVEMLVEAWEKELAHAPVDIAITRSIQIVFGGALAVASSEIVRRGKGKLQEYALEDTSLNLIGSARQLIRKNLRFALLLTGVVAYDYTSNIWGGSQFVFDKSDTQGQITNVEGQIMRGLDILEEEFEKVGSPEDLKKVESQAYLSANKALIDEVKGKFSESGPGPRFLALAAAYFEGEEFQLLYGHSEINKYGIGAAGDPDKMVNEEYDGWTIQQIGEDSWKVFGVIERHNKEGGSTKIDMGWVIGPMADAREHRTARNILESRAADETNYTIEENGEYRVALNMLHNFHDSSAEPNYVEGIVGERMRYARVLEEIVDSRRSIFEKEIAKWEPGMQIPVLRESVAGEIQPMFDSLCERQKSFARREVRGQEKLGEEFKAFNVDVLDKLRASGGVADIPTPAIEQIKVECPEINVPSFTKNGPIQQFLNAVEKNVLYLPLGVLVAFLAFVISYMDILFYFKKVKDASINDRRLVRERGLQLRKKLQLLLDNMYDFMNESPFRVMYGGNLAGEQPQFTELFLRERMKEVLEEMLEESDASDDEGKVMGKLKNLLNDAIKDFGEDSPIIQDFNAVSRAIQEYLNDPQSFQKRFLKLSNGENSANPQEVLRAMYTEGTPDGYGLTESYREEVSQRIDYECNIEGSRFIRDVQAIQEDIDELRAGFDPNNPLSLIELIKIRNRVGGLDKAYCIDLAEEAAYDALGEYLLEMEGLIKGNAEAFAIYNRGVTEKLNAERIRIERAQHMPALRAIDKKIGNIPCIYSQEDLMAKKSLDEARREVREGRETLREVRLELGGLKVPASVAADKNQLLNNCRVVEGHIKKLEGMLDDEYIQGAVKSNRDDVLHLLSVSCRTAYVDSDSAAMKVIRDFLKGYKALYGAREDFVDIQFTDDLESNDYEAIISAFEAIRADVISPKEESSFSFTEYQLRTFDPEHHIGKQIEEAFKCLGEKSIKAWDAADLIDVPDARKPIGQIRKN